MPTITGRAGTLLVSTFTLVLLWNRPVSVACRTLGHANAAGQNLLPQFLAGTRKCRGALDTGGFPLLDLAMYSGWSYLGSSVDWRSWRHRMKLPAKPVENTPWKAAVSGVVAPSEFTLPGGAATILGLCQHSVLGWPVPWRKLPACVWRCRTNGKQDARPTSEC